MRLLNAPVRVVQCDIARSQSMLFPKISGTHDSRRFSRDLTRLGAISKDGQGSLQLPPSDFVVFVVRSLNIFIITITPRRSDERLVVQIKLARICMLSKLAGPMSSIGLEAPGRAAAAAVRLCVPLRTVLHRLSKTRRRCSLLAITSIGSAEGHVGHSGVMLRPKESRRDAGMGRHTEEISRDSGDEVAVVCPV